MITQRDNTPGSGPPDAATAPPAFLRAIVDTIVAEVPVVLTPEHRRIVSDEATAFVAAQLGELAPGLRWRLAIGLLGFRAYGRLARGRAFERLPEAERLRLVGHWSHARVAAPRQLFRLLRSLALLSVFERGEIRAALTRPPGAQPAAAPAGDRP